MMVIAAMPLGSVSAEDMLPLPEKITCAIADKQAFQQPDRVHLTGWIGSRMEANAKGRAGFTLERGWENFCREVGRPYYPQSMEMGPGFSKTDV